MNDVSCKVFDVFMRPLAKKGVSLESLVGGSTLVLAKLKDRSARIDWADFVAIMRNLRRHFTDEEYVELGRTYMRQPGIRFAFVVARLLYTVMDIYRWFTKPRVGLGNQMFTCVGARHHEISANELEIELFLPEGFEQCWDFYVITTGNFEEVPRLVGLPRAKVTLTRIPDGGRYRIVIPERAPLLTRIRQLLFWPFTARAAARELRQAHEALVDRYEELDEARTLLDQQAAQLRTAHTVNALILRDVDLNRTLENVTKVLVEEAGFKWAELTLTAANNEPKKLATCGDPDHEAPLTRLLASRGGEVIGSLAIAMRSPDDRQRSEQLLALIAPALATGLQNALYRTNLEQLVDQRTVELRQARDELAGTVDKLREAQGARERFFGNISHEIRTPLSIIMLAAADIEMRAGAALDSRSRAGLGAVTVAARKLVRLVDELLLLAAGQEDKLKLAPEPTDLVALVQQLVAAWRPAAEAAQIALSSALPAALAANIDPVAIERVATNLVSNAIKYTPEAGRVDVELAEENGLIRLSVLDTGPGIADELAGRLFGRYERAAGDDRRKAGTGLGLSVAKQLVEAHAGSIAVHPRPGGGAELRVTLPGALAIRDAAPLETRLRVGPDVHAPSSIASGTRLVPPGLSKGTILLAEDDARLAEMVGRLLADEYVVVIAHDGLVALELVRAHQPQMLITDVDMPGLSGIELSRRFREQTGDTLAPIIILSAVLDLTTRVAGLEAGAIDYVTKPFDPLELKARVRAQFRMRDIAVRLHRAEQLSSLGLLTSGLAHELRNPANGIVNAIVPLAELLPPELRRPETAVGQLIEVIQGCADQIAFLARHLLGFRRGGIELELRHAVLDDLIRHAISLAQRALSGVDVRSYIDKELAVMCAPPLMTQVLTNLVENAGHAAGRGGWVEIRARVENARLALEIADSGPGVPLELRDRVFEPFFTTKPVGVGTGLGLSLARDIIHRHGGTLEIRERSSRACFVIDLPQHSALDASAGAVG